MSGPVERVKQQQREWASSRCIAFDDNGYVSQVEDNLFQPLHSTTRAEFEGGKGDEIKEKLRALHSSAALVCNLLDYWRDKSVEVVAEACEAPSGTSALRFERQLPGLRGIGPHLDVELHGQGVRPTAIESKLLEPYSGRVSLKEAYVRPGLWKDQPRCGELANCLYSGQLVFEHLNAPQLLAHVLGLTAAYGSGNFRLLYLWFDMGGPEAERHRSEIAEFRQGVVGEIDFDARTHQQVFEGLRRQRAGHPHYCQYLAERYFGS